MRNQSETPASVTQEASRSRNTPEFGPTLKEGRTTDGEPDPRETMSQDKLDELIALGGTETARIRKETDRRNEQAVNLRIQQLEKENADLQTQLGGNRTKPGRTGPIRNSFGEKPQENLEANESAFSSSESDNAGGNDSVRPIRDQPGRRPRPRLKDLPTYREKGLKDAQLFIYGAERRFRVDAGYYYPTDQDKIDCCVLAFDKGPAAKWERYEQRYGIDNITWKDFTKWIYDTIQDPINREFNAVIEYEEARQRFGQSTDDFASYLDTLELELGIKDDRLRRNFLFGQLTKELQRRITNYNEVPQTRDALISLGTRLENSGRLLTNRHPESRRNVHNSAAQEPRENSKEPQNRPRERGRFRHRPYQPYTPTPASGSNTVKTEGSRNREGCKRCGVVGHTAPNCPEVTCFKCNKKGHYASNCPELEQGKGEARR